MASQTKEILITFVLPVKAAEEPKHQYTAIIGLDFEQSVRVPLLSNWARCHQITSWKLLISCHLKKLILLPRQRQKLYWTLTSIYASDFVSLKIYIATRLSSYFKGCYINF